MKSYNTILLEKKEGIGYLTLNRPVVRNAFNQEMIEELTLQYNKARQAGITAELTEIVSSAQATA